MLTIRQMMRYLRNTHNINIRSSQSYALRNMGYYHGYKGYRFVRDPQTRIPLTDFNELLSIYNYDMQLKTLLYPKIMFIETALKSYVIEAVLNDCHSENLTTVFNNSLTYYKTFPQGTINYHNHFSKRMSLRGSINNNLKREYGNANKIVNHFFDNDREIPIWAIFESMTLGDFGIFFGCCNINVRRYASQLLHLPVGLDTDGEITRYIIFTLRDLRNAIAHNNVIFDARFRSKAINRRLITLLQQETGINNIDFKYVDAYIILTVYILRKMKVTKTECKQLVNAYVYASQSLRNDIPTAVWNQILGTATRTNMATLMTFITNS